jgi:guanylate kinase
MLLQKRSCLPITGSSLRVLSLSSSSLGESKECCLPMKPLVICGPSGVGKGTIISRFMQDNKSKPSSDVSLPKFVFSVSHTTRQPREGEVDGVHYQFCTKEFMQDKIDDGGFFIEHAQVHGNLYGTSFQSIFDASSSHENRQCLLDIDVEGVKSIKNFQDAQQHQMKNTDQRLLHGQSSDRTIPQQSLPELQAKFIFIAPPSIDALHERLMGRGSETPESLQRRFSASKAEIEYGTAPGNFDAIIVNDNLERACKEFEETVRRIYSS